MIKIRDHKPATQRTHDADGRAVDEPVQCADCLQTYPCEVEQLKQRIRELELEISKLFEYES